MAYLNVYHILLPKEGGNVCVLRNCPRVFPPPDSTVGGAEHASY